MSFGGPVLTAPRVQPIYLPGFAYQTDIDGFLQLLPSSQYWPSVVSEYGVGTLTVLPSHTSSVAAGDNITVPAIATLLNQIMSTDQAALGAPRQDTIYALFFPATTTITDPDTNTALCDSGAASGFHVEWTVGRTNVVAVVIPSCSSFFGYPDLTGAAVLTPTLSHELVEASTDPFSTSQPAFADTDEQHALWSVAMNGGEVADLCENDVPNLIAPTDLNSFPVQRIWSNAAVHAGTGPCVPVPPGEVYFSVVGQLPSQALVTRNNVTFSVPVIRASTGAAASVVVDYRSLGATPASWSAGALEYHPQGAVKTAHVMSTVAALNSRQSLPIAVPENDMGVFPVLVGSETLDGQQLHFWVGGIQRTQ
jgi:hypothetical protein